VGVTVGSLDLEDALFDGKERNIKGTTTEIEDEDVALTLILLVESVGNGSSGWLVNDSLDVQTSDGSGILGCLSLGVVEVSWDRDDGVLDWFSEVSLSDLLHLDEDHGGDLFGLELLLLAHVLDRD